jgi:peptide/nickel transport system ATP-binding protein
MDTVPAIAVDHLNITLSNGQVVIQDLSFNVEAGKALAIVGEAGSGKSLTALALVGLLPPTTTWQGSIQFNTSPLSTTTKDTLQEVWQDLRGRVVSMIFQDTTNILNPTVKVGRQLSETIQLNTGLSSSDARVTAIEWLQRVQILNPEAGYHKYPHQLSSGQKQRVMIAMAMCGRPTVVIADEPTAALDVIDGKEIVQLLKELQHETGTALIFTTNDLALATTLADDMLLLHQAGAIEHGPTEQVLNKPQAQKPGITSELLLQVRHLRVWFPTESNWLGTPLKFQRAVEDVSFDLLKEEAIGLLGESGSGKSAIARALTGLQEVESGSMVFEGRDLARLGPIGWRRMRREIQIIFRDPRLSFNPSLTVGEIIGEPLVAQEIVPRTELKNEIQRLLNLVHLPPNVFQRPPHQLSGDEQLRIALARALALRPKLLICDEIASALDANTQTNILNLLKELQAELKLSYLFISNDPSLVRLMADKILVIQSGRIIERGSTELLFKHPEHEYTRKLLEAVPHL